MHKRDGTTATSVGKCLSLRSMHLYAQLHNSIYITYLQHLDVPTGSVFENIHIYIYSNDYLHSNANVEIKFYFTHSTSKATQFKQKPKE